ncbi:sensor domain-containing diguanylate cyclase [Methylomonas sp. MgM2]
MNILDIAIETLRASVIAMLLILLWQRGRKESLMRLDGWREIILGVSLILFATILDITDNFPMLSKFVIIGDTPVTVFLKTVVGYLGGDILLFIGFWRWILLVPKLDKVRRDLQEQEARFRAMVETSTDWVWAINKTGQYTYASPLVTKLLGYSPEEVLGRFPSDFMAPEEAVRLNTAFADIVSDKRPFFLLEKNCLHKNGRMVILESSGRPLFDPAGEFVGYQGIDRDITERKQVLTALRDSELRYRNLAERSPLAIQVFSPDGITLRVNAAWEKLWNTPFSALEQYNVLEDRQLEELGVLPWLKKAFSGECVEIPVVEYDKAKTPQVPSNGGTLWIRTFAYPVQGEDKRIMEVVVIQEDVTKSRQAQALVEQSESHLRAILNSTSECVKLVSEDGILLAMNPAGLALFEAESETALLGQCVYSFVAPEYREMYASFNERVCDGEPGSLQFEVVGLHGSRHWVETRAVPFQFESGKPVQLAFTRQIDELKQAEALLKQQKEYLKAIFETEPECVKVLSVDGRLDDINPAGLKMLEVDSLEEARQSGWFEFIEVGYRKAFAKLHKRVCAGESATLEFLIKGKKGAERWLETHATPLRDANGNITSLLGITRDITEHKLFQQTLEQQARTDFLTGVNNRRYFMELVELELSRAVRYKIPLSLYMMDIDFFKEINDLHGHKAGDMVLIKLGKVCKEILREVDIIGRIGGEEFAIMLPETDKDKALDAAERLREAISNTPVPLEDGLPIRFTVSIGMTSMISVEDNLDMLLNRADKGLYEAKQNGRNKVCAAF